MCSTSLDSAGPRVSVVRWVWLRLECETISCHVCEGGDECGCWRWPWSGEARFVHCLVVPSLLFCYREIFQLPLMAYIYTCQVISLQSNQYPRNWFIAEVSFYVCCLVPNIYISKLYVIYRTLQRSENRQRSDLVIFESGELYHLNHHLKVCCPTSLMYFSE